MASSHDPLKLLISSMDTNEKRYYKLLSAAFKSNSKTLQLFDLLDAEEDLSDSELMTRLKVSSINSIRMLLRKQLLRAMRIYQEERNERSAMRGTIGEIEFLLSKQLTGEAEKEIRKAYKKAESANNHLALYELTLRNNEIRKQFRTSQELVDEFEGRISEMDNLCERLLNMGRLRLVDTEWNLYIQSFDRGDANRNQQFFRERIEPILNGIKPKDSAPLETIHAAILRSGFNTLLGDIQVSESAIGQANRLFDLDDQLLVNRFSMFFALNYNHSCGLFIRGMVNESLTWTLSTEEVLARHY
ncbi:MAG: hypothetical protein KDB98_13285, partial [Flavobacteriales bacterium]|nr:hypothetical protein [Flavobacteriales bacterium]